MSLVHVAVFALPIAIVVGYFLGYRGGKDRALRDNALDKKVRANDAS